MLATTISTFMASHHKECDEQFAKAEESIANGDWEQGIKQWQGFANELERHFSREENILFPEFESETGMTGGPTQMMRMEHEQMRTLFAEMKEAMEQQNSDDYLGAAETLLIMMQQHNMKEEQILYNMMDQRLPDDVNNWQKKFENWNKQ